MRYGRSVPLALGLAASLSGCGSEFYRDCMAENKGTPKASFFCQIQEAKHRRDQLNLEFQETDSLMNVADSLFNLLGTEEAMRILTDLDARYAQLDSVRRVADSLIAEAEARYQTDTGR